MNTDTEAVAPITHDRLSSQDASFVYAETAQKPLHVGLLAAFEDRGANIAALRTHVASRLHLFPRLRKKLAFVPFDQGHPVWTDDEGFDIATHVSEAALSGERDMHEAQSFMARFMSEPLLRSQPLWQMRILSMSGERFALAFKIHHCLLDGMSAAHLVTVLFDLSRTTRPTPAKAWEPALPPAPRDLFSNAIREHRDRLTLLARRISNWRPTRQSVDLLIHQAGEIAGNVAEQAAAMLIPRQRAALRGGVGPYRRFEGTSISLQEVKDVKNRRGSTVNDVALTIVAAGVGRMLRERGVDTDSATVKAAVPVSRRPKSEVATLGNQVSLMTVDLPVDDDEPTTLLARISRDMRALKHSGQADGADFWIALADYTPPVVLHAISRVAGSQHLIDLIVTNVPGPAFPLYLLGGEMLEVYPFVPLFGGTSLAVGVVSYNGRLYFGLTGDHDAVPDLRTVTSGLTESFAALRDRSDGDDYVQYDYRNELPSHHGAAQGEGRRAAQ